VGASPAAAGVGPASGSAPGAVTPGVACSLGVEAEAPVELGAQLACATKPVAATSRSRELAARRARTITLSWYHASGSRAPIVRISPLCLALALGSCAPSSLPRPTSAPPPPPLTTPAPWSRFEEISALPTVGEPFENLGHAGAGELAQVRVSPASRAAYEALVRDSAMPEGTVVALSHAARSGVDPGSVYVMEKQRGAWSYLVLTARGVIAEGAASQCSACHAGAVGDSLFGLPRAPVPVH
jgi:hypothetical protein